MKLAHTLSLVSLISIDFIHSVKQSRLVTAGNDGINLLYIIPFLTNASQPQQPQNRFPLFLSQNALLNVVVCSLDPNFTAWFLSIINTTPSGEIDVFGINEDLFLKFSKNLFVHLFWRKISTGFVKI